MHAFVRVTLTEQNTAHPNLALRTHQYSALLALIVRKGTFVRAWTEGSLVVRQELNRATDVLSRSELMCYPER